MDNQIDPAVGSWYQHLDDGDLFQVVGVDEDEQLIEFQHFDGDIEEVTLNEWRTWDIEVTAAPEDWTGPVDDIERDDLDYSEIRSESLAEERRRQMLQDEELPDSGRRTVQASGVEDPATRRGSAQGGQPSGTPEAGRADGLSRRRINEVRARLTSRAEELRLDVQRELRKYDDESYARLAEEVADSGDRSWSDLVSDVNLAEVTRDVEEMRDIGRALQRLAQGSYGICISCGDRIDPARQDANPAAIRCLACQSEFENRDRQTRYRTL
jgi:RNA polymerase-binding transcription factor DksA